MIDLLQTVLAWGAVLLGIVVLAVCLIALAGGKGWG